MKHDSTVGQIQSNLSTARTPSSSPDCDMAERNGGTNRDAFSSSSTENVGLRSKGASRIISPASSSIHTEAFLEHYKRITIVALGFAIRSKPRAPQLRFERTIQTLRGANARHLARITTWRHSDSADGHIPEPILASIDTIAGALAHGADRLPQKSASEAIVKILVGITGASSRIDMTAVAHWLDHFGAREAAVDFRRMKLALLDSTTTTLQQQRRKCRSVPLPRWPWLSRHD